MTRLGGGQIVCESLLREGVEIIFGIPGGQILPLYDTLPQYPKLRHVLCRHEQGAVHAAEGFARATGRVGVCFTTSGPGATNLVTGLADAYMDSIPVVAITGQVSRPFIGRDAFQEADITGITIPITKHNYLVMNANDLARTIKEAFYIASTGRPGPVLIDIPRDVQVEEAAFSYPEKVELRGYRPTYHGHPTQIEKAAGLIAESERPVILAGHGVNIAGAQAELRELAEKAQMPVINTFLGLGSFPRSHFLSYGMLGMHGMGYANLAVQNSDLLIAIGMRFDDRVTGRLDSFAARAKVVHIDVDPAEIGKNVPVHVPIVGDVKNVLQALNRAVSSKTHGEWLGQLEEWRRKYPIVVRETDKLIPQQVVEEICRATGGETILVTGVGQHQMWCAQHFLSDKPHFMISSGGLGTMGFGLPAAMGAKAGCPHETVWCLDGDGSFQMNIQELATLVQENIAVKIAIINNGHLGMVRQWQELLYQRRYVASPLSGPDFVKIAEAYGILGLRVTERSQVAPAITRAMEHPGPVLIDFQVEPEENVYPMVPPGAAIADFIEAPSKVKGASPRSTR